MTDGVRNFVAQERLRKQPILTDTNNIFTYRFQPLQRLQPNFMTDGRRTYQVQHRQPKGKNILSHTATTTHATQIYD